MPITVPIRRGFLSRGKLEVARNGAVQQGSSRGEADRIVLSSVVDSSSVREHDYQLLFLLTVDAEKYPGNVSLSLGIQPGVCFVPK